MARGLAALNAKWQAAGRMPIAIGIGLNTGMVNVGNMGSARRLSWTVMGDNVNLASRLEGITKQYHVQIVISEATYRQVVQPVRLPRTRQNPREREEPAREYLRADGRRGRKIKV